MSDLEERLRGIGDRSVASPVPTLTELRAVTTRRRARRRTAGVITASILVVVAAVGLAVDDDASAPMTVQSPDVTANPSGEGATWALVGETAMSTSNLSAVATGDGVVLASDVEHDPDPPPLTVRLIDPSTGESTDLRYGESVANPAVHLHDAVAWSGGAVILGTNPTGYVLHRWGGGQWSSIDLPAEVVGAGPASIGVAEGVLLLSSRGGGGSPDRLYRRGPAIDWVEMPRPGLASPGLNLFDPAPGGILHSTPTGGIAATVEHELWSDEAQRWDRLPVMPVDPLWTQQSAWFRDQLMVCGAHSDQARYDCLSWEAPTGWSLVAPPPLPQEKGQEGFGFGLQGFRSGNRFVVGANDGWTGPARWAAYDVGARTWRELALPPGEWGSTVATTEWDGARYVVFAGAADDGADGSVRVARFSTGGPEREVAPVSDVGPGLMVRVPDGWDVTRGTGSDGRASVEVVGPGTVTTEDGTECPALRVVIDEIDRDPLAASSWPGTDDLIPPNGTAPCVPLRHRVTGNERWFEVSIDQSGPEQPGDREDLATILGSFRATQDDG